MAIATAANIPIPELTTNLGAPPVNLAVGAGVGAAEVKSVQVFEGTGGAVQL